MVGKNFSHYRVIEKLGSGGMGVVYLAEDLTLGRQVALKVLLDSFASDDVISARFKREARLAAAINHPNVCTIFEVGEFEGRSYIAMELLQGRSLRQYISGQRITSQQFLDWTLQMVTAVEAAHARGILHRDLKPANLFIASANRVKILDFGLSKLLRYAEPAAAGASDATRTAFQTNPGNTMGTPAYMSPEQVRGDILDVRSDLFSLGVVMYEMATGKLPFEGPTTATVMAAILRDQPQRPDLLNASLPPEVTRFILKALEKDRELRYQSARELLTDLRRLIRDSDPNLPKASPGRGTLTRGRKYVLSGLLGSTVAAVFAFLLFRQPSPPRILSTQELTHDRLRKSGPLLTDGSRVYFNTGLVPSVAYGVSSQGGESFKVPIGMQNATLLAESPDHSEFLIRASTNPGLISVGIRSLPLWISSVSGGSLRRLGDLSGVSAAWSPDGQHLVYSTDGALEVAMADGSVARTLVKVAGQPFALRWSPDGKLIRFSMLEPSQQILEVRSDGTQMHALFPAWHDPQCCGNWTPDGKYFVFEAANRGVSNIWALRERRGVFAQPNPQPVKLTSGPLSSSDPVPSTDGKRIFVTSHERRSETVRYDLSLKALVEFLPGLSIEGLDFTRDGKWVTYVTFPEGILWRSRTDGQERLQLTQVPMRANLPRWSPDGTQIIFMGATDRLERPRVFLVSAQGGASLQITDGKDSTGFDPTWSPDGSSIAMGGLLGDQGNRINLLNLTTHKLAVLAGSFEYYSPRWSPDGRYIAAESNRGEAGVAVFSFESQKWTEVTNLIPGYITWSKDSQFIYFDTANSNPALFRVRVSDHKVERIFDFKGFQQAAGTFGFWNGLAPDGSPLFQRDLSLDQIYSLEWQAP